MSVGCASRCASTGGLPGSNVSTSSRSSMAARRRSRCCSRSPHSLLSAPCSLHFPRLLGLTLHQCRQPSTTIPGTYFCIAWTQHERSSSGGGAAHGFDWRCQRRTCEESGRVWMQSALLRTLRTLRYSSSLILPSTPVHLSLRPSSINSLPLSRASLLSRIHTPLALPLRTFRVVGHTGTIHVSCILHM
ncbi:hypothetical protein C8F01DRAFT_1183689 [Mycena amicta]|nr:hypothetical protein C8F01DRAFT_1183689 [Mycena amicta]